LRKLKSEGHKAHEAEAINRRLSIDDLPLACEVVIPLGRG
jgi:hypothetical protein